MNKNLKFFGKLLKELRIKKELSLREVCKLVGYDSSNWSKIERGMISPPSDKKVLMSWAKALGFLKNSQDIQKFVDSAQIAQGIIPQDILSQNNAVDYLPAFFRTMRNAKPTREEIDRLIELIRNA